MPAAFAAKAIMPACALAVAVVVATVLVFVILRDGFLRWVKRSPERERRWMLCLEDVRFAQGAVGKIVKWITVVIGVVIILAITTFILSTVAINLSTVTINPIYVGIAIIIMLLIMILYKLDTK
jgi:hypothetical protein